ncbi:MAG: YceI family protein [Candidatus Zixiibacteriota bacterium]
MIRKMNFSIVAVALTLGVLFSTASAEKFYIAGMPETDSVIFASDAKLEFIEGKTNAVIGLIEFDPTNTQTPCTGHLRVEAKTLKTGIDLRDQHMRERHLHTEQYPYIDFVLKSVAGLPAQLPSSGSTKFQINGEFTVHGTTKPISAPATVELLPASGAAKSVLVTASFNIKLDDYGVPRPKMLLLKLAETINIRVRFIASTANPPVTF